MNYLRTYLTLLSYSLLLVSCQKVIQIEVDAQDQKVVIEAIVTDDTLTPHTVKITKSVNLDDSNGFPYVTGANVKINDNAGNTVTLTDMGSGIYQNSTLKAIPGRTYYLTIVAENKTYTSFCTMPQKVTLDSILISNSDGSPSGPGGTESGKTATPVFQDPLGKGNYYKFKLEKNAKVSTSLFLFNDDIIDGGTNLRPLNDFEITIKKNDTVKITMMCIDKAVNLYFYSLSQNGTGPAASATPANPVTNIEGTTLGYFSAHTVQTKTTVVK